jgi:phosphate/sulfate permease
MSLNVVIFIEKPMSNSMSLEKIFIIIAIILGFGSAVDLIYALADANIQLAEVLRCILNIVIAGFLYLYFNKKNKHKAKVED